MADSNQRPTRVSSGDTEEVTPSSCLGDKCLEPRSGDIWIALGREPQDSSPPNNRQPRSGDRCPDRRTAAYAAAENLSPLRGFLPFSRPYPGAHAPGVNIFRASGALFSSQRPTRDSPGDSEEIPRAVIQEIFERSRSSGRYFARSGGGGQTTCRSSSVAGWGRLSAVAWSNGRCTRSARFEW